MSVLPFAALPSRRDMRGEVCHWTGEQLADWALTVVGVAARQRKHIAKLSGREFLVRTRACPLLCVRLCVCVCCVLVYAVCACVCVCVCVFCFVFLFLHPWPLRLYECVHVPNDQQLHAVTLRGTDVR